MIGILVVLLCGAARAEDASAKKFGSGADVQAALDALPEGGGEVFLPPGIITVMNPIILNRDGLSLRGSGASTILRLANRMNVPVVILGTIKNKPTQTVANLRLADVAIDGNRENQKAERSEERRVGKEC